MKFSTHLWIWLVICMLAPLALSQRSSYEPAANKRTDSRPDFTDFVLKQINPQNIDYGCQIEGARRLAVDETVKNIGFWTIVVALSLLILSFFILVLQYRESNGIELLAARFLAQYHNSLVDARSQAQTAIRRYNELVIATDRVAEKVRVCQSPDPQPAILGTETIASVKPKSTTATAVKNTLIRSEAGPSAPAGTKPLPRPNHASEVDLMAQVKTLQQQLAVSHEREKNLKRELNKVQRHGQAEPTIKT